MADNGEKLLKKRNAEKVCKELTDFFAKREWSCSEVSGREYPVYVLDFKVNGLTVTIGVSVAADLECVRFTTVLPVSYKSQNRVILSYKLAEINPLLRYGAFYPNTAHNLIAYEYSLPYSADAFRGEVCEKIILSIIYAVDSCYKTIAGYAQGQIPEEEKNEVLKAIRKNVAYLKNNA